MASNSNHSIDLCKIQNMACEEKEALCQDSSLNLKEAWEDKNLSRFEEILSNPSCDPNAEYIFRIFTPRSPELNVDSMCTMSLLSYLAYSKDTDAPEYAALLLNDHRTLINNQDKQGYCPIHYAAEKGNINVFQLLLQKDVNIYAYNRSGITALHALSKQPWMHSGFAECLERLLQVEIKSNNTDIVNLLSRDGEQPIETAFRLGNKPAIELMLRKAWNRLYIDDDLKSDIGDKYPDLVRLLVKISGTDAVDGSKLMQLLINNEEDRFCQLLEDCNDAKKIELVNFNDGSYTLFHYALAHNYFKAGAILLEANVDVNFHPNVKTISDYGGQTALHYIARCSSQCEHRTKCFDHLLRVPEIDINAVDDLGDTALHYGVRFGENNIVLQLLKNGAYIGVTNNEGETPLTKMPPEVYQSFLDWSVQERSTYRFRSDYVISFNYKFLMPPACRSNLLDASEENEDEISKKKLQNFLTSYETKPLLIMSECHEIKHLLCHPVLTSFTFLKWQSIQKLFWINLFFYLSFCSLLTICIFTDSIVPNEKNSSNVELLQNKSLINNMSKTVESTSPLITVPFLVSRSLLLNFTLILLLREVFQFSMDYKNHFKNFENILEVFLILATTGIVFGDCGTVRPSTYHLLHPQFCAIAILLSYIELLLLIGKHPRVSIQIEMFHEVSKNFVKFLGWHIVLVFSFALSFYILFRKPSAGSDNKNLFADPGNALLKTMVMMAGEFEAASIPFEVYVGVSHIIFISFLFFIAIVLSNLINGLAVSDTKTIRAQAYLYTCIARISFVVFVEKIIMALDKIFITLCSSCTCMEFLKNVKFCSYFLKNIAFFPNLLPQGQIDIFPNEKFRMEFIGQNKKYKDSLPQRFKDKEIMSEAIKLVTEQKSLECDVTTKLNLCISQLEKLIKDVAQLKSCCKCNE